MGIRTPLRHLLVPASALTLLLSAVPAVAASPGTASRTYAQLLPLADLSAQRLRTADQVAAAKWGTGGPVDDPARERQVLDAVAARAGELGADPAATVRIFRDQIEANKTVQRGLHRRWEVDPSQAPAERPDLAEVREEINRLNDGLVAAVAASARARAARSCGAQLTAGAARVRHEQRLGALHTKALVRALSSVCSRGA
ncbi:chorismate mutase [Streptomyces stramineus]|uniref:Chorismate mutase n=1 Tax=Streptomyces stramineus TaxID=173861 RepID=A0ABN1AM89_9ACTN